LYVTRNNKQQKNSPIYTLISPVTSLFKRCWQSIQ